MASNDHTELNMDLPYPGLVDEKLNGVNCRPTLISIPWKKKLYSCIQKHIWIFPVVSSLLIPFLCISMYVLQSLPTTSEVNYEYSFASVSTVSGILLLWITDTLSQYCHMSRTQAHFRYVLGSHLSLITYHHFILQPEAGYFSQLIDIISIISKCTHFVVTSFSSFETFLFF